MSDPTWGVVSTIKAPARDILSFAAHHLDLGAHRVIVYLDDDNPAAFKALKAHPKCRVIDCDDTYWKRRKGRPEKHQARQTANATRCYRRGPGVDWLAHIDVDEFLWPQSSLPAQLAMLSEDILSARIRPVEALAPDPANPPKPGQTWFKSYARKQHPRRAQTATIYPTYGQFLNGGFLSHVAGKIFVRTGTDKLSLRIHNAFVAGKMDENAAELSGTVLCHMHAATWEAFRAAFAFRLAQGSYRSELKPVPTADGAGVNMNALFSMIEDEGGESALSAFYDEVCTATPSLRAQLLAHNLLYDVALDLDAKRARHFPQFA
ncbi:MAG: glycosyltransferase family 2 protein [Roseovarius sp.]